MNNNKPIYIMSLEASDIYYHNYRSMDINKEYKGMIPFSLESMKLIENGLKTTYIENRDKYISNDIINVKFKSSVKSADDMIEVVNKKIEYAKNAKYESEFIEYKELLEIHSSKSDLDDTWDKVNIEELRRNIYSEGFYITFNVGRNGKTKRIKYVVYKRSSAKSRTGQCLFIKESMYNKMIKWSRMSLPFRKGKEVDLASLLAYESLVGSSLESTIEINPDNILIVDDVDSKFKKKANVVRTNEVTGKLDSFKEESEVSNSLFDGESLLDARYFNNGKSMLLLRNHMFKSASFNCNIQKFLLDNIPDDTEYDNWEVSNMYGDKMLAKDIHMICTPSSLKALKFSNVLPTKTEKEMWSYWKDKVKEDGNVFGICKSEKESKLGYLSNGEILQQTSYQMINCLPVNEKDIAELSVNEIEYIMKLKNDMDFLMEEVYKSRDISNANESLYEIYKLNKNIAYTPVFKNFKDDFIYKKTKHAKKGKLKIEGDYCVLLGNPIELLKHAIGKFDISRHEDIELKDNEVHCTLFPDNERLIGFRNPNTSPSNVLMMDNKINQNIKSYLNLTKNIIVVNAIRFPIQDILSGCDYDSDTMLVSNNEKLVKIGDRCFGNYDICLNKIKGDKKKYKLTNDNHFQIDNQLSHSQRNIGRVVNLGQLCMSTYWDLINRGMKGAEVDELLKKVNVMTILSGIAIDMAKKFYDINMDDEILEVSNNKKLKEKSKKPNFWVFVSVNKSIKNKVEYYKCPMDYLISHLNKIEKGNHSKTIDLDDLFVDLSIKKINTKQVENVENLITEYISTLNNTFAVNDDDIKVIIEDIEKYFAKKISKWKLSEETIMMIIRNISSLSEKLSVKTIKILFENHTEAFKNIVKIEK